MQSISFIGLGAIGTPMASHLAKPPGALTVWNRTRARADEFSAKTGARVADSPRDAGAGASVVFTCLPKSSDVASILSGADGLLAGLSEGAILVDCTSGDPATSRKIAAQLAERGVGFIDAPVSGGVVGAEKGTLTVMVGGDPRLLEQVRPLLEKFGRKIVHCGPVGAGDALKAVNNALLAAHIWTLAEGLITLEKVGVSPAIALDVINASSGRSNASENLFPERVLTRAFPRTFRLALLDKDVGIAADIASQEGIPATMLSLTAQLFRDAHAALGEEADHVEAVRHVEHISGVDRV